MPYDYGTEYPVTDYIPFEKDFDIAEEQPLPEPDVELSNIKYKDTTKALNNVTKKIPVELETDMKSLDLMTSTRVPLDTETTTAVPLNLYNSSQVPAVLPNQVERKSKIKPGWNVGKWSKVRGLKN